MSRFRRHRTWAGIAIAVATAGLAVSVADAGGGKDHRSKDRYSILVFSRTAGFAHPSIPVAVDAIEEMARRAPFKVDTTTDPSMFTPDNLDRYAAVVFVSTTGNVLPTDSQRAALEGFIRSGGGFVGIHAASDMGATVRNTWPWYRGLVGAAFKGHTATHVWADVDPGLGGVYQGPLADAPPDAEFFSPTLAYKSWFPALVRIEEPRSPAMRGWGRKEWRVDEWYGFLENPRANVEVLATVDESTYEPAAGAMGDDHPIVWCQAYDGGRSFYTAMGHPAGAWDDRKFLRHIRLGIEMVAGSADFRRCR